MEQKMLDRATYKKIKGMTREEMQNFLTNYYNNTQHDINLTFLSHKGFDTTTLDGLQKALFWLKTADADELMHGDGTGDSFNIIVGEMRRPMLIESVEKAIREVDLS